MTIQGKLHKKFETKQVSATFQKREFVIDYVENPLWTPGEFLPLSKLLPLILCLHLHHRKPLMLLIWMTTIYPSN